jgi:CheY-like chemotaxis protein
MKPTILVVEDTKLIRTFIKLVLKKENYNVIEAGNGEEALQKCMESPPDLILMDIMMPGMNGIEVTRLLKEDPALAKVPVIMLTALTETEAVLESYEYGADYYLSKPVDRKTLIKAIKFLEKNLNRGI